MWCCFGWVVYLISLVRVGCFYLLVLQVRFVQFALVVRYFLDCLCWCLFWLITLIIMFGDVVGFTWCVCLIYGFVCWVYCDYFDCCWFSFGGVVGFLLFVVDLIVVVWACFVALCWLLVFWFWIAVWLIVLWVLLCIYLVCWVTVGFSLWFLWWLS